MDKYKNGKIYKLSNEGKIYIGSTCDDLKKRLSRHKKHYKQYLDGKMNYISSFDLFKNGEVYIELIENFSCNTKAELNKKEQEIMTLHPDTVNKYKAYRTIENKLEQRKKDNKKFKKNSIEKYIECQNRRSEKIKCSCGIYISKRNKARHLKICSYIPNIDDLHL